MAVEYSDFPVAEWTVYFKNIGGADTLILENIQGLDTKFERKGEGEFVLHGNKGDWCAPEGYEPYQNTLGPGTNMQFAPDGGRPDERAEGLALLQRADAGWGMHRGHWLAGAVGVPVRAG